MLAPLLLLACAHRALQPMDLPVHLPDEDGEKEHADGGFSTISVERYDAAEDARGTRWVASFWSRPGEVLGGAPSRYLALYALIPPGEARAWTWSSPEDEAWRDVDLGTGADLDLVIEQRWKATDAARWVAIDPEARAVVARGALPGTRCGEVLPDGEGAYLLASGHAIGRFEPASGRFTPLWEEGSGLCLRGRLALGAADTLVWVTEDGQLRLGAADGGGEARTLGWPGLGRGPAPWQYLRVVEDPEGAGAWLFWSIDAMITTDPRYQGPPWGIYASRLTAEGVVGEPVAVAPPSVSKFAPAGVPLASDGTWDVSVVDDHLYVLLPERSKTQRAPTVARPVAAMPAWTLLSLSSVDHARVTEGPGGPRLWATTWGEGGHVWTWRDPLPAPAEGGAEARAAASRAVIDALRQALGREDRSSGVLKIPGVDRACVTRPEIEAVLGPGQPKDPERSRPLWLETALVWEHDRPEPPFVRRVAVEATFEGATGCLSQLGLRDLPRGQLGR